MPKKMKKFFLSLLLEANVKTPVAPLNLQCALDLSLVSWKVLFALENLCPPPSLAANRQWIVLHFVAESAPSVQMLQLHSGGQRILRRFWLPLMWEKRGMRTVKLWVTLVLDIQKQQSMWVSSHWYLIWLIQLLGSFRKSRICSCYIAGWTGRCWIHPAGWIWAPVAGQLFPLQIHWTGQGYECETTWHVFFPFIKDKLTNYLLIVTYIWYSLPVSYRRGNTWSTSSRYRTETSTCICWLHCDTSSPMCQSGWTYSEIHW